MKRFYEDVIARHFREERQMLFLMGPRQVGKTTTSREVGAQRSGSYLNWDNLDHQARILAGPERLAEEIGLTTLHEERRLLILDELHKYPRWRTFLKGFYDTYADEVDVLVTGSARLSVFHAGGESLMGRYFGYRMHPLSVAELVRREPGDAPGRRPPARLEDETFQALLELGGFPEPFLRQTQRFALRWQRLRHQQLLREELRDLTRIQETGKVGTLTQLLTLQAGQMTRYATLSNAVDASIDSIRRWLESLESLYFCFSLRPWFKNVARSLRKEPKIYLWDWSQLRDAGPRFENLVACALLKAVHFWNDDGQGVFELRFLRDKEKREVDFVVVRDGRPWMLVEAKVSGKADLSKGLLYFQEHLGAEIALQVAYDLPYVDRDCFTVKRPTIVPARTFLSQLV